MLKKMALLLMVFLVSGTALAGQLKDARLDKNSFVAGKESVTVTIDLDRRTDVRVSLWKNGKLVHLIDNLASKKKQCVIQWDGTDAHEKPMASGKYILKVQTDEDITLVDDFGEDGVIDSFISPAIVRTDPLGNVWVSDIGTNTKPVEGNVLYKFDKDGEAIREFPCDLRFASGRSPQMFAFDDEGFMYVESGGHTVMKLNENLKKLMSYGGMTKQKADASGHQALTPESTVWGRVFGVGPDDKLYIAAHRIKVYDRTASGFDGFLYESKVWPSPPRIPSRTVAIGPAAISNPKTGEIYWLWHTSWLSKLVDTGKALEDAYYYRKTMSMDPGYLTNPTGVGSDWAGTVFVANRMNHRIEQFIDTGHEFKWVRSYGSKGSDLAKKQFFGIHDVHVSGDFLYILEDGEPLPFKDSKTQGNHRLSKWKIIYGAVKDMNIEIK